MQFSIEKFLASLPIMGISYLGIFLITGVIIVAVMALNFLTKPKK